MKKRADIRVIVMFVIMSCCILAFNGAWAAEKYPSRPVSIVVTFAPGGVASLTARIWASYLEKYLGGTFVVDNRPGGGGVIGYTYVANAKPDGYTLGNFPDFIIPILNGSATYKLDDLQVIAQVALNGCVLCVNAEAPWKTFQEFADYARKNPGVKWAHQGVGTMIYFRTENLNKQANLKLIGVPMKGDSEIIPALLGKHVAIGSLSAALAKAQAQAGKLRILFSFDPAREFGIDPAVPDFPTLFPNMQDVDVPIYLIAPKKTPKEIADVLEKGLEKMTNDPDFIKEIGTKLHQMVSFLPGKIVMEQKIPKKMALMKAIMQESGSAK
jgi:tripartite-type tricarboxylate transporter receptor subunit TctC